MARKNLKWGNVQFQWLKSHAKIITDKGFTADLNRFFAQILSSYAYDYIPYSYPENNNYEGRPLHLADLKQIRVYTNYALIIYEKSYASIQYNGYFNHINQQHPKATRKWVEAAWANSKQAIVQKVRKERKRLGV